MTQYEFALVVEGFDPRNDEHVSALAKVAPEVTASGWQGNALLEFSIRGKSGLSALKKARANVERAIPGSRVLSLAEDLVGIPDIASRTDRTEESIRQLVSGLRGPGGFPTARGILKGGSKIWRWSDVVPWLLKQGVLVSSDELIDQKSELLFSLELLEESAGTSPSSSSIFRNPVSSQKRSRKTEEPGYTTFGASMRTVAKGVGLESWQRTDPR